MKPRFNMLRFLKKLLEILLDGFWKKHLMNHENSQTLNPSQNFPIKNRPWFPKQRPENDEKQELVRVALVKAKIVSELNSQKLEQKANKKNGLTRERVEKYALVWAPQKTHFKFQSCDLKDLCFFRVVWEFGWICMYFLIFPRRIVVFRREACQYHVQNVIPSYCHSIDPYTSFPSSILWEPLPIGSYDFKVFRVEAQSIL